MINGVSSDIWKTIMSYFHSSYKIIYYDAFKTIKLYKDFKNSEKLWYIDDFDNLNVIETHYIDIYWMITHFVEA